MGWRAWAGGGWDGVDKRKYRPMSPGLPLIELQPLRARQPDKRTNSSNGARAQDTPGIVHGDVWPPKSSRSHPRAAAGASNRFVATLTSNIKAKVYFTKSAIFISV